MATDPNLNAARVVQESTSADDALPPDLEAAWVEWSSHIQKVETRMMTLLRAAFEAGAAAASTMHGRAGGLKGGKARAAKLSKKKRSDIAKKAASARWAK